MNKPLTVQYRAEPMPVTIPPPSAPSKVWPDLRKRNRPAPHQRENAK